MSALVARLRDIPEGDGRPLYYDTMEEAANTLERIESWCKPCGENLLPEQVDCPFCGQVSVPIDQPFTCGKGGCPLGGDL